MSHSHSRSHSRASSHQSQQLQFHQQLMGRSPSTCTNTHISYSNPIDNPPAPSLHIIVDPFAQNPSSPYPPSPSSSRRTSLAPSFASQNVHVGFDPDLEAERVRRRKLEARRSHSILSPDSQSLAPPSPTHRRGSLPSSGSGRRGSLSSSIVSSPQMSSSLRHRRPNGSPLSQVHHPSPLRSASTPTLDNAQIIATQQSEKMRQKQMKADYEKMRSELIEIERSRLKSIKPIKHKTSWFNSFKTSRKNHQQQKKVSDLVTINNHHHQEDKDKDPFRKSLLSPLEGLITSSNSSSGGATNTPSNTKQLNGVKKVEKPKRQRTLTRMFGTLLASSNKPLQSQSQSPVIKKTLSIREQDGLGCTSQSDGTLETSCSSSSKPSFLNSSCTSKRSLKFSRKQRPVLPTFVNPSSVPIHSTLPSIVTVDLEDHHQNQNGNGNNNLTPLTSNDPLPLVFINETSPPTNQAEFIEYPSNDLNVNNGNDDNGGDDENQRTRVNHEEQEVAKFGSVRQGTGVMVVVVGEP